MTSASTPQPVSGTPQSAVTGGAAVHAALLVLAETLLVFGAVLVLCLTVPAVRDHLLTSLAVALPLQGLLALAAERHAITRHGLSWQAVGFRRPTRSLWHLLWELPVAILALVAVQGTAFAVLGESPGSGTGLAEDASAIGPVSAVLIVLATAVLTPLWEEALFRGLVLGAARGRWGTAWAVVVSALVFAAAHGFPLLLPYLVTMGLLLAWLRVRQESLWASLALHSSVNLMASSAVLAAVV